MDWDSPTNKRYQEEAEARGCKLVGPGRSRFYRLYQLPCGHEKEIQPGAIRIGNFKCGHCLDQKLRMEATAQGCQLLGAGKSKQQRLYLLPCGHEQVVDLGRMRAGSFRCGTCMGGKLSHEAEIHGCKLLGPGKNPNYRLYKLPCGHEQELVVAHVRKGGFKCQACVIEKFEREAKANNCKLVGPGRSRLYRLYELPCGHEQEVHLDAMRRGNFSCKVCKDTTLNNEAMEQGCVILGAGKRADYRLYKLPCGHKQEILFQHMRKGIFKCQSCLEDKLGLEAKSQACKILGPGRSTSYRWYELPCGHKQEVNTARMRDGGFKCNICLEEKLSEEAATQGCELLGAGRSRHHRMYRLGCRHEQEVTLQNMRDGSFVCQTCEETSRTLPSNLYLLHIKVSSDEWLKLGYAKSVEFRSSRYGLIEGAEVTLIDSFEFPTGNEAHAVEAELHKRFRRHRLASKNMRQFHTISGFKECYPVTLLDTLLAELESLKEGHSKSVS